jgi:hypothetical protein
MIIIMNGFIKEQGIIRSTFEIKRPLDFACIAYLMLVLCKKNIFLFILVSPIWLTLFFFFVYVIVIIAYIGAV